MLQPLNVPTQSTVVASSTQPSATAEIVWSMAVVSLPAPPPPPAPQSALAKVCAIEFVHVPHKTKRPMRPSLYTIELFFCPPGRASAMLALTWRIGADTGTREPDVRLDKPYLEIYALYDAIHVLTKKHCAHGKPRCRLCDMLSSYMDDQDLPPHVLDRAFVGTKRKCEQIREVLSKIVYFVVRAQRPARPSAPYTPNCDQQAQICELVATFFEL